MTRQSNTSETSKGVFITFEGGEGTGKTTQIEALGKHLEKAGRAVVRTREPGGSPGAEAIRDLLVNGDTGRWLPSTEAQLHYAARNEHLERVIRPALKQGAIVLCDRFADSTMAYQGLVQGLGAPTVKALDDLVVGETRPDLTLVFDLDSKRGLERAAGRSGGEDRYERMGQEFHANLREAFLKIAMENPQRCILVDASKSINEVETAVWNIVSDRLDLA